MAIDSNTSFLGVPEIVPTIALRRPASATTATMRRAPMSIAWTLLSLVGNLRKVFFLFITMNYGSQQRD
jgi:hypothetical protein